jgi:nucleotide-binding universal stress UspA family protein
MAEELGTSHHGAPVVVCYDGSGHAADSIATVAALLPGAPVLVVTVWKRIRDAILAVSLGPSPLISDLPELDERQRRAAEQVADEGARRAAEAGLDARPLVVLARDEVWAAVAMVAEEQDARLIVCATRRAGISSTLFDTLPGALVHHATRPVTVVPSRQAAAARRRELLEEQHKHTRAATG